MKPVGLLGGTFDPVHIGHLELAHQAMEYCDLSKVLFVPSFFPPHKPFESITPFTQRVEMLNIALTGEKHFFISEIEAFMPRPCYTIDTLSHLQHHGKEKEDYFFIIGIDAFIEIPTWKNYKKVLECVNFIVSSRSDYNHNLFEKSVKEFGYLQNNSYWYNSVTQRSIYFLQEKIADVSSSEIRKRVKNSEQIEDLVQEGVRDYITSNNLYL